MNDRKNVLELFEKQKDLLNERVEYGIEHYRKGDAKLTVTDRYGKPIENARIKIRQKSHEFRFGANIFMLDELETEEKNEQYKKHFADTFNMATLPFYWDTLEPERGKPRYSKYSPKVYRRPAIDLCMEFCEKHGIEPREHALAYEHFFPQWLSEASVDEIKEELERRFSEISERYADMIPTIEVTNEMEWAKGKTAFYDDPEYVKWCFKLAEQYFPNNKLTINEWGAWNDNCRSTAKYYAYTEANMLKGARIDAIGLQFHLFYKREVEYEKTREMLNPESLYKHMDLYSNFGKPLQITEITIPAYSREPEDEAIQAEILEKLYSIWFSHPNVEQIIYWNLVDGYAFGATPGDMTVGENYYYGGLLRFDLSPKPAYYALQNLIKKKWRTNEEICTDSNGIAAFRGFFGDYEAVVCINGKETVNTFSLKKKGERDITIIVE